jgi:DNA-binding FadR family transcriptional regulator
MVCEWKHPRSGRDCRGYGGVAMARTQPKQSQAHFTPRQGQFLAYIHAYTLVNGRPPAEADMMRFFRVTPPSVHQMVLALEKAGLISRQPGVPRSIVVLLDRSALPELQPSDVQSVKINRPWD